MVEQVTKIDEDWDGPFWEVSHHESQKEATEYLQGKRGTSREGRTHYNRMKAWIHKNIEYQETHQYADGIRFFLLDSIPFYCPLKYKKKGEMVKWPGYGQDPPGLYTVPTKQGGYSYEVDTEYYITLHTLAYSRYKHPASYVRAYEKHHK